MSNEKNERTVEESSVVGNTAAMRSEASEVKSKGKTK